MSKFYNDNSIAPIIAIDFDGTFNIENVYPDTGIIRPYAKEICDFLHDIGVKIIVWTSRDHNHSTNNMVTFLNENDIPYNSINSSIDFAPYYYESRKIYAHMYVDDRAYGWTDTPTVMCDVLREFLISVLHIEDHYAYTIASQIKHNRKVDNIYYDMCKDVIRQWN